MKGFLRRFGPALLAVAAALFLAFAAGLGLGVTGGGVSRTASVIVEDLKDLRRNWRAYYVDTPTQHLVPRHFDGDGVVLSKPDRMQPGPTFLGGLFGQTLGFRLYAADGTLLHEWPIDFFKVAPDLMRHRFHALIHGAWVFDNGDVVANLDGRALVRFDLCGRIVWQNREPVHHSVFVGEDGLIWAPVLGEKRTDPAFGPEPFAFDRVAAFDPDTGEKVEDIDLYQVMIDSDMLGLASGRQPSWDDVTHVNDVEIVSAAAGAASPVFDAGDILISSRNFHQLWVIDRTTRRIKWHLEGPNIGQHDPDLHDDGTITMLDNRTSTKPAPENGLIGERGGSRILQVDPASGARETLYRTNAENTFYTQFRGKHQMLDNGNILIAETDMGRVFEVTGDGALVWSFVNGYDADRTAWVMDALRLPPAAEAFADAVCE